MAFPQRLSDRRLCINNLTEDAGNEKQIVIDEHTSRKTKNKLTYLSIIKYLTSNTVKSILIDQ